MKEQIYWGVFLKGNDEICFTFDMKHPEDKRKAEHVRVLAIYPNRKDAEDDAKFRGESVAQPIKIMVLK